ncbi:MAG TPA: substrate-binding domain-containing protein [Pseudonocardiaceae bacterium]
MKHTRRAALGVLAAAVLATAACGNGGTTGGEQGSMTIALSVSTLNNPFFVQLKEGAEEAARELGVTLTVLDAQNDAVNQVNQVQTAVTQGVKAVVINPVDSDQAAPAAKAAENAGVPVVAADRSINNATVVSTVASDNVQGGQLAAEALAQAMGGGGEVVVLQGVPGASASRERGQGFQEGVAQQAGLNVVATQPADFDRAKGLDVMTNLLQAHPNVKGVFAENDEMALGAIKALGDRAGQDVVVVGFDGTPDGLAAIEAGQLAASIAQQPREIGRQAVEQAVRAARGEQTQQTIQVPVKVVTKENVAEFTK